MRRFLPVLLVAVCACEVFGQVRGVDPSSVDPSFTFSPQNRNPNQKKQPAEIWADKKKTLRGFQAAYLPIAAAPQNQNLNLKVLGTAFHQIDPVGKFNPPTKKHPADTYTVQWEGLVEVLEPSRIILMVHGRSRFWIDLNQNGAFEAEEQHENGWIAKDGPNTATSKILQPGDYPIRIHYQSRPKDASITLKASPDRIPYHDFDGNNRYLHPWLGRHIALLTLEGHHDPGQMAEIVEQLDIAFEFYAQICGRKPWPDRVINGLAVVAEVPQTCGAGCGMVGATGVEIIPPFLKKLLEDHEREGAIEPLPLYEFGRNFLFHGDRLSSKGWKVDTGSAFATAIQLLCYHETELKEPSYFENIRPGLLKKLREYEEGLKNPQSLSREAYVGMILTLEEKYGGAKFAARFWQSLSQLRPAGSWQDTLNNFAKAASIGANTNLTEFLNRNWNFKISDQTKKEIEKELELNSGTL